MTMTTNPLLLSPIPFTPYSEHYTVRMTHHTGQDRCPECSWMPSRNRDVIARHDGSVRHRTNHSVFLQDQQRTTQGLADRRVQENTIPQPVGGPTVQTFRRRRFVATPLRAAFRMPISGAVTFRRPKKVEGVRCIASVFCAPRHVTFMWSCAMKRRHQSCEHTAVFLNCESDNTGFGYQVPSILQSACDIITRPSHCSSKIFVSTSETSDMSAGSGCPSALEVRLRCGNLTCLLELWGNMFYHSIFRI